MRPAERFNYNVTMVSRHAWLYGARTAQNAGRQVKERGKQRKDAVYRDAEDAKWQSDEPDKRKQDHRQQG